MYKPHPKQKEFFESKEKFVLYPGGLPSRGYYNQVMKYLLERKKMIDKPYAYHKPSPDGLEKINKLREHFSEGERLIREICPQSRHQSVALTNNETTAMWAIKAVVFNDPDSEVG
jgi:hypothetical protein